MSTITMTTSELLEMKIFHQNMLHIINKKLQAQEKQAGVSTSAARKGPVPEEQIIKSKNKRLKRISHGRH
jgi:hypothetical protein